MTANDDLRVTDNEVFLRGRLADEPQLRTLPSGDEFLTFRVIVPRAPDGRSQDTRARVDSIDCAASLARVRRCVERAAPGDQLEVSGVLHRRFWRSPGGLASRYEVIVDSARRGKPATNLRTGA